MEQMTVTELYTLKETIASEIFAGATYPWEVLPKIGAFIVKLGSTLPETEYEKIGEDIWVAKSAKVAATASIHGPAIIGKEAEIRERPQAAKKPEKQKCTPAKIASTM